jgi:hypothetical protein
LPRSPSPTPTPKLKMLAPSTKNGRFSGRNVSNADRFTTDGSASTWPKSGLTWRSVSGSASCRTSGRRRRPVRGRRAEERVAGSPGARVATRRPCTARARCCARPDALEPCSSPKSETRPVRVPRAPAPRTTSRRCRAICRRNWMPHGRPASPFSLNRSCESGIRNSAVQPSESTLVATSQTASQLTSPRRRRRASRQPSRRAGSPEHERGTPVEVAVDGDVDTQSECTVTSRRASCADDRVGARIEHAHADVDCAVVVRDARLRALWPARPRSARTVKSVAGAIAAQTASSSRPSITGRRRRELVRLQHAAPRAPVRRRGQDRRQLTRGGRREQCAGRTAARKLLRALAPRQLADAGRRATKARDGAQRDDTHEGGRARGICMFAEFA